MPQNILTLHIQNLKTQMLNPVTAQVLPWDNRLRQADSISSIELGFRIG